MQIPLISGIYTDNGPDIRVSYPVNMVPVAESSGISDGYLRPADGIVQFATGHGIDRGGINWNGVCYRVSGSKLISVDANGSVSILGDVGNGGAVMMDYSFDRLAIASNGNLFYWDGSALTQVTDPDLGTVLDVIEIDSYFMTTEGQYLVVTDLSNPLQVSPFKYGSSEADPDRIVSLLELRNEVYALNRHTIEVFDNVGGDFFPFQRIEGAQIQKGCIGVDACCMFSDSIAFLGGGRNEAPSIYLGSNGQSVKLSTPEIDRLLSTFTEAELSTSKLEAATRNGQEFLYCHLPDRTLVFNTITSKKAQVPAWHILTSSLAAFSAYRARNFVWCYNKWIVGDVLGAGIGEITDTTSHHWGNFVRWEFATPIIYGEGISAIINELELVALTGRVALGSNPAISTSYSIDGASWSQPLSIRCGGIGDRLKHLVWFRMGFFRLFRIQRFQGDSQAHVSFLRLEAKIDAGYR